MSRPTVCAVMLVSGREEMVKRAVKSFREQMYPAKRLLIWDTGELNQDFDTTEEGDGQISHIPAEAYRDLTVGALRNEANAFWTEYPIIVHMDSDDYSHPNRIAEQVALLQSSGKQCVGYRDMLFWKTCPHCNEGRDNTLPQCPYCGLKYDPSREAPVGEAWLYSDALTCLGTSLCYWREVWERRPFPDLPKAKGGSGEDVEWLRGVDSLGALSIREPNAPELEARYRAELAQGSPLYEPRMIASIHGGNTQYYGSDLLERSTSWKRAPEWNAYARENMAL